jgi:hypothetical protein
MDERDDAPLAAEPNVINVDGFEQQPDPLQNRLLELRQSLEATMVRLQSEIEHLLSEKGFTFIHMKPKRLIVLALYDDLRRAYLAAVKTVAGNCQVHLWLSEFENDMELFGSVDLAPTEEQLVVAIRGIWDALASFRLVDVMYLRDLPLIVATHISTVIRSGSCHVKCLILSFENHPVAGSMPTIAEMIRGLETMEHIDIDGITTETFAAICVAIASLTNINICYLNLEHDNDPVYVSREQGLALSQLFIKASLVELSLCRMRLLELFAKLSRVHASTN